MKHQELVKQQSSFDGIARCIGYELWWSVPSCSIPRTQYLRHADSIGVPERYLKDQLSLSEGLTRCTDSSVNSKMKREYSIEFKRLESKKLATNEVGKAVLYSEQQGRKIKLYQIGVITGHTSGLSLRFTPTYDHSLELGNDKIQDLMDKVEREVSPLFDLQKHDRDDIVRCLIEFTREHGVSLRDSGGIYFIPAQHQDLLNKVTQFVQACQPDAQVYVKPEYVMSDQDLKTYQAVSKSAIASEIARLEESYNEMRTELLDYRSSKTRIQKRTKSKFFNALKDFNLMRDRVSNFSKALSLDGNGIADKVFGMHADLEGLLDSLRVNLSSELRAERADVSTPTSDDKAWDMEAMTQGVATPEPALSAKVEAKTTTVPAWLQDATDVDFNDDDISKLLNEV